MPQPNLPAPLAQRPEPGDQLLEAVRQRQAQRSLQLAQHWVHRRGVVNLQHFCSTHLSSDQGPEAVAWLQALLALDSLPPADGDPAASATPEDGPEAAPEPIPLLSAPDREPPQAPVSQLHSESQRLARRQALEMDLEARAVAAVDEAFAALALTFQEPGDGLADAPDPAPSPAPRSIPPRPLPVRAGLWPSLRASATSLGAAIRTAAADDHHHLPDVGRQAAAAAVGVQEQDPSNDASRTGAPEAASPTPVQQDNSRTPEGQTNPCSDGDDNDEPSSPLNATAEHGSEQDATTDPIEAAASGRVGLLQRLRGPLQRRRLPRLSRLRAVMRDCLDETVALLRTPEPDVADEPIFDTSPSPQPSQTGTDHQPPSPSWTLEPFLPPSTTPVAGSQAEPGAAAWRAPMISNDTAPPAPADRCTPAPMESGPAQAPAWPLPPACLVSRPGGPTDERPAPAPAALSDLRAWLPDRGDLPRAS